MTYRFENNTISARRRTQGVNAGVRRLTGTGPERIQIKNLKKRTRCSQVPVPSVDANIATLDRLSGPAAHGKVFFNQQPLSIPSDALQTGVVWVTEETVKGNTLVPSSVHLGQIKVCIGSVAELHSADNARD
jgi:hypothetical protein